MKNDNYFVVLILTLLSTQYCTGLQCYNIYSQTGSRENHDLRECEGVCIKAEGTSSTYLFNNTPLRGCAQASDLFPRNTCGDFRVSRDDSDWVHTTNGIPKTFIKEYLIEKFGFTTGKFCTCDSNACNTGTRLGHLQLFSVFVAVGVTISSICLQNHCN